MAVPLDASVIRAINKFARTSMGRKYGRFAKKNYGMSGKKLMAKTVAGESGGKGTGRAGVSSAGARGPAQFIPSTREAYISQYGVDPWKNDFSAMKGMAIHHMGTGVAGYNPGMPTYESYILGQKVDKGSIEALRKGGRTNTRGRRRSTSVNIPGSTLTETSTVPGIDNSALRQQVMLSYLDRRGHPGALLDLATGLDSAQDVPGAPLTQQETLRGQQVDGPGGGGPARRGRRDVVTGSGQSVMKMLRKAAKWDKAKAPYLWGGGHGSIARPGDPVDCSGFVSAVLGLDTPQVSGNLASWGKPGKGKWVTVYADEGHTFMSIKDPRTKKTRWFGTSGSNPGGGAGEMPKPDAGYLSRFVARHPG